uniref:Uncharacterized protein n=1 Tax=Arundo donax TaxID=35708 RepID=A0A0A8YY63_ARUDO
MGAARRGRDRGAAQELELGGAAGGRGAALKGRARRLAGRREGRWSRAARRPDGGWARWTWLVTDDG